MNWEMVGAISELFGAVAVVLSLAYLARQLRMGREVDQRTSFQSIVDGFTEHSARFFESPNDLAVRGLNDRSALSDSERALFDQLLANLISHGEMAESASTSGLVSNDSLDLLDWYLRTRIFKHPGGREWLDEWSPWYSQEYRERLYRAASKSNAGI